MAKVPLAGSERQPMPGATPAGKADPGEQLEVSVLVRRRHAAELASRARDLARGGRPAPHLSHEAFDREFGASTADIAAVKQFAAGHGLSVSRSMSGRRTVVLSGTVVQFNAAFDVDLQRFDHRPVPIAAGSAASICRKNSVASSKRCWAWTIGRRRRRISAGAPQPPRPTRRCRLPSSMISRPAPEKGNVSPSSSWVAARRRPISRPISPDWASAPSRRSRSCRSTRPRTSRLAAPMDRMARSCSISKWSAP